MINTENLNPFPKFCCSIGMIPPSYNVSLTYEEQLLWLCDFLKNTVIPTVNNNAQAVEELQNLFVTLTNYVKFTDYASSSKAGVGKVGAATGINISEAGLFYIVSATSSEINDKTNSFKPIVPSNLDYAVSSIVGHHITLTQAQYDALETKVSDTYYYIVEE